LLLIYFILPFVL